MTTRLPDTAQKLSRAELVAAFRFILQTYFWEYCKYIDPVFFTDDKPHLIKIANALQKVSEKKIMKLVMSLPPRAGKSYIVSVWCSWMIGKNPAGSIMRNSYGQSLAEKFSYDIRDIIKTKKYTDVFPAIKLKDDKQQIGDWAVVGSKQSSYFCSGVGGAITGKGCNIAAILDDPVKNLEDAMSETISEKTWNWYLSTHKSRMETGCPEIHIATRWSKKDPIGRLVESEAGEWTIITVPALDESGKSFCESVKTTAEYEELKKILDAYIWEAEFMQNPIEAIGLLFPPHELNYFSMEEVKRFYEIPEGKKEPAEKWDGIIGYTDTADEGSDYLASMTCCLKNDRVYVPDVVFTQEPIEITEGLVANQILTNKHDKHITESNNGGKGFSRAVQRILKGLKYFCDMIWKPTTQNKETKILMKSGVVKQKFYFRNDYPAGSDYDKFMRNLTSYMKAGKNKHDDAPDCVTSMAGYIFKENSISFLGTN